jgi:hypothetical protein
VDNPIAAVFMTIGLFFTAGLTVAAIRRRQTGSSYLLFWRNPLSEQTRAVLGRGFFRGASAELARILFFAMFTLVAAANRKRVT